MLASSMDDTEIMIKKKTNPNQNQGSSAQKEKRNLNKNSQDIMALQLLGKAFWSANVHRFYSKI